MSHIIGNGPVVPLRRRASDKPCYSIKAAADGSADLLLYDVIGDSWDGTTAKQFAADLKAVGDVKVLNIYINSPGGSVFDGVAIFNQLKRHKARKIVQIDGYAASIASVVAMAGDEIRIAKNGMMMIHDPWAIAIGSAADFRKMAESLDKVRESILGSYVDRSTSSEEQLSDWMAAETWFTAEEAVDAGLADMLTDAVDIAALSKHDLSMFRHAPETPAPATDKPTEQNSEERTPHPTIAQMEARLMKRGHRQGRPA
jgi:ATP-dependent Clp protease protease subunit